jgi:hypothetical protein
MRLTSIILLLLICSTINANEDPERQIAESLRALPEGLRANASVIGYDESGERVPLKKGSNGITCWADDPSPNLDEPFYVLCFPKSLEQFLTRNDELKRAGVIDRSAVLEAEIELGKIELPKIDIRYTLRGKRYEEAMALTIIHVPYATAEGCLWPIAALNSSVFRADWAPAIEQSRRSGIKLELPSNYRLGSVCFTPKSRRSANIGLEVCL